jgi:hypothetical protein
MTRRSSATKRQSQSKPPQEQPAESQRATPVIRMRPQRGLFFILLGVFIIWIGFLVTLYFTTVYHKTDVHEKTPAPLGK